MNFVSPPSNQDPWQETLFTLILTYRKVSDDSPHHPVGKCICESGRIRTYSALRQRGYSPSQFAIIGALPNMKQPRSLNLTQRATHPTPKVISFAYPLGFEPRSHGLTGRRFRPLILRANMVWEVGFSPTTPPD
jgi:hypothetical protein